MVKRSPESLGRYGSVSDDTAVPLPRKPVGLGAMGKGGMIVGNVARILSVRVWSGNESDAVPYGSSDGYCNRFDFSLWPSEC